MSVYQLEGKWGADEVADQVSSFLFCGIAFIIADAHHHDDGRIRQADGVEGSGRRILPASFAYGGVDTQ